MKGSNTFSRISSGRPTPESATISVSFILSLLRENRMEP